MGEMLKNTTYEQDNLIIEKKRVETVVVATGEGALLRGQVLGMVTLTGEYKKYKADATTGEEIPRLILLQDADATSKEVKVQALRTGRVNKTDVKGILATDYKAFAELADRGIYCDKRA